MKTVQTCCPTHTPRSTLSSGDHLGALSPGIHPSSHASPTPLVSRVFFYYSCLISFAFLQKLLKSSLNTKFYLSPQMVKQNQISGTWLLNQHSRGYAAVPSVPTLVGHLWRPPPSRTTSRVWLLCLCQVLGEDISIQQSSGKQCQHLAVASCSQPRPSCPCPADSYSSPMNTLSNALASAGGWI